MITLPFRRLLSWFAIVALAGPLAAQSAAPLSRIATIDVNKVMTQTNEGKAAFESVKKVQRELIDKASAMNAEIQKLEASRATSASPDSVAGQVADQRAKLQRFSQDADRQVAEARDRAIAALEAKTKPIIDKIGTDLQLDAIFNKYESGLVFVNPRIDITDEVIKRLNEAKP
jgi:outer membrane protein